MWDNKLKKNKTKERKKERSQELKAGKKNLRKKESSDEEKYVILSNHENYITK
jgi:hypothetical protein